MGKRAQLILLLALPIAALRMTTIDVTAVRAAAAPFSCAILRRGDKYLAEVRGTDAQAAAGRLTCYGGKRERGETSLQCLVRELNEELGWAPEHIPAEPACSLLVDGYLIAHFYEASVDRTDFETEGRAFEFVDESDARWSAWHARVLAARGDAVAIFDDGGDPSATLELLRRVPTAGEEGLERRYYLSRTAPGRRCCGRHTRRRRDPLAEWP